MSLKCALFFTAKLGVCVEYLRKTVTMHLALTDNSEQFSTICADCKTATRKNSSPNAVFFFRGTLALQMLSMQPRLDPLVLLRKFCIFTVSAALC